jgi:hypothetical protein
MRRSGSKGIIETDCYCKIRLLDDSEISCEFKVKVLHYVHVVIGLIAYFMSVIVGGRFRGVYVLEKIDKRSKQACKLKNHALCKNLPLQLK